MGEVVSLRRARKAREKKARDAKAQENRVAFGRTKVERNLTDARARLEAEKFDAHRLERAPGDEA